MKKQTGIRLFFAILKIFALVALVFLLYSWGKKAYSFGYQVVAQEAVSRPPGKDVAVTLDNGMTGEELQSFWRTRAWCVTREFSMCSFFFPRKSTS